MGATRGVPLGVHGNTRSRNRPRTRSEVPFLSPHHHNYWLPMETSSQWLQLFLGTSFQHRDAPLAPEEDRWQWLSGITGTYMYQRAVTMWMGRNQALDVDDSYQYPWNSRPLSMSEW